MVIDKIMNGVQATSQCIAHGFKQADRVVRDLDPSDAAIRCVANGFLLNDLITHEQKIPRSVTTSIEGYHNIVGVVRVFGSIGYFLNGDFMADIRDSKYHFLVTNVAFLIGRLGSVAHWAVNHGLVKDITMKLTPTYFAGIVSAIRSLPIVDMAFITAFGGIAADSFMALFKGDFTKESFLYHSVNAFSLSMNITGNVLSIVASRVSVVVIPVLGVSFPVVITVLGIVSTSTAVAAFLLKGQGQSTVSNKS